MFISFFRSTDESLRPLWRRSAYSIRGLMAFGIFALAALLECTLCGRLVSANTGQRGDSGSITGTVTADGRPAAGIWVTARQVGGRHNLTRSSATDDAGRFAITELPYGTYTISSEKNGYVSSNESATASYYRPGDTVTISLVKGGVITGKVTDSDGAPVVAIRVVANAASTKRSETSKGELRSGSAITDDRGIYRIYGLFPGRYLVRAGDSSSWPLQDIGYRGITPTYYPSATIDTASAVEVRSGAENAGIDIRFREEAGHAISGRLIDSSGNPSSSVSRYAFVSAYRRNSGMYVARASAQAPAFAFAAYGIADGDYDLVAEAFASGARFAVSEPLRVTVKGADITGLSIQLQAYGSISGTATLQPMEKPRESGCGESRPALLPETLVVAANESAPAEPMTPYLTTHFTGAPDENGNFEITELTKGQYHLDVSLPDDEWYLRSIESVESTSSTKTRKRKVTHVEIHPGSAEKGLTITIAQGAARIDGRIKMAKEGQSIPEGIQVYLIPGEPESAKDPFRYREGSVQPDGKFSIANIPIGKYRLLAEIAPVDPQGEVRHISWKEKGRAQLQQDVAHDAQDLELKPCQKIKNYSVVFKQQPDAGASAKPSPGGRF